jgi:hypothetical protein
MDTGTPRDLCSSRRQFKEGGSRDRPLLREVEMRWFNMYLLGYMIFLGGVLAALWKLGLLEKIGTTWVVIGLVIALGVGWMWSVSAGSPKNINLNK